MSNKLSAFLDDVCIHVRCKSVHKELREELTQHINELTQEYEMQGNSADAALNMAIAAMGDTDEIGGKLDKQHKPQTEWSLIGLVTLIAIMGGIIMFIYSKYSEFEQYQTVSFEKYLLFSIVGIGVMIGLYFFDYTKLKKMAWPLYLIAFALLIFTLISRGEYNGRKFLVIGNMAISPDYAIALFLVAFVGFLEKCRGKGGLALMGLIAIGSISIFPILMLPSFAYAIILLMGYGVLIISAVVKRHFGGSWKMQIISLSSISLAILTSIVPAIIATPYRLSRITVFLSRGKSDPAGGGWIQTQVDRFLSASAWFGQADTTSVGYDINQGLPGIASEYILVGIIASLGWIAGIALMVIVAFFIARMFMTIKKIRNDYGRYLSVACCAVLTVQFIISILLNFNLCPLVGISMPFVSYGGTGYIVSMALVGIILSVWRRNNLVEASPKTIHDSNSRFITIENGKLIISFK